MEKFENPSVGSIRAGDVFFAPRIRTNHTNTLPANVARCQETGRIDVFHLDWKPGKKNYTPHYFWDSDFAKVVEGLAYNQILFPDPEREKQLDEFVDLIVSAQQKDGYLNTYFTLVEPDKRWTSIASAHELYCAGHLMEAASAYFQATGKRNFLDAMCRYADYIATVFGPGENQLHGYPGHEEIELALCKLAQASGNEKYRVLAKYFIDERGKEPNFFLEEEKRNHIKVLASPEYFQAHKPVREQRDAVGHAVRAMYLYCGMADIGTATDDTELLDACKCLWESVTNRNMYITGGIGSSASGERFTRDYDLPNSSSYAESCASIGLVLFAERMANITGESKYADVMEKCLYNGALSGLSLAGTEFFYANPMEVGEAPNGRSGFLPDRQPWFGCSCCPTNYCRFLPQIPSFAFAVSKNELRIHIPVSAEGSVFIDGNNIAFRLTGKYPYDGKIRFELLKGEGDFNVSFRIPGWCKSHSIRLNGQAAAPVYRDGYAKLGRIWKPGDVIELDLAMEILFMRANAMLDEDAGKFVFQRGPVLYALEGTDNGRDLARIVVPLSGKFEVVPAPAGFPEDTMAISGTAYREQRTASPNLYSDEKPLRTEIPIIAIPYALWGNRGKTTMRLWLRSGN